MPLATMTHLSLRIAAIMSSVSSHSVFTTMRRQRQCPTMRVNCLVIRSHTAIGSCCAMAMESTAFMPVSFNLRGGENVLRIRRMPPIRPYNVNRYDRFRQCLVPASKETSGSQFPIENVSYDVYCSTNNETNLLNAGRCAFEVLHSRTRRFKRTWNRMNPLVELIVLACSREEGVNCGDVNGDMKETSQSRRLSSIVDIGCDHGMLSLSLACIAWVATQQLTLNKENHRDGNEDMFFFSRVIGTDVSEQALASGGFVSFAKMTDAMQPRIRDGGVSDCAFETPLPIEFRVGCGMDPLQPGDADAVVLAGMGAHTMLNILFGSGGEMPGVAPVDRVQTTCIFLQPANSRPQHMITLYDRLQKCGNWVLVDERISFVGGRWYISIFFARRYNNLFQSGLDNSYRFPGHCLNHRVPDDGSDSYDSYVKHHLQWLKKDYERPKGLLEDEDIRWVEYITSSEENMRWARLASWFTKK